MKSLKLVFVSCSFLFLLWTGAHAQSKSEKAEVLKPVNLLFEGMLTADSSKVSSTFADGVQFFTVGSKAGEPFFQSGDPNGFLRSIAGAKKGFLKEVISNEKVQIDGPLATVWCDYQFYLDGKNHHCGVNMFLLLKTSAGWKIRQVTDTRRNEGCQ